MKIKNLLCAAAMAGIMFSTINEVGAEPMYTIDYDKTKSYLSVYLDADDTNVEAVNNHGKINTLYLDIRNYTNNTSNSVVYNNYSSGAFNNPSYVGTISTIRGTVENSVFDYLISGELSSSYGDVNLVATGNTIGSALVHFGGISATSVKGTYTNNQGGTIITAALGGAESITGTFKDNNSSIYGGALAFTNVFDATIENNHQSLVAEGVSAGAILNYVGVIGQLSGSIKNNSHVGQYGGAIFNSGAGTGLGVIGMTTKNNKDTVVEGNYTTQGDGEGIYNAAGTLTFNTDDKAKIIINDKISGDLELIKKLAVEDGMSSDNEEEVLNSLTIENNKLIINPSQVEHFHFPENAELDASQFLAFFDLSKTTGIVEFNNLVSDQSIHIYDGTLKLGSWTDSKGVTHRGDFKNVNLYMHGGTLDVIDGEIHNYNVVNLTGTNGKLSIDLDLYNNTADTLTAELVNGTFNFNDINVIGAPVAQSGSVQIIAGNVGENGITLGDFVAMDSNFNTVKFTDGGNGKLNYTTEQGSGDITIKVAVDYNKGDRSYSMTKDEVVNEDLWIMAGKDSTLTVNGNGHTLDGNGHKGIVVERGQTLILNDLIVKNFKQPGGSDYNSAGGVVYNAGGHIENMSGTFINNSAQNNGYDVGGVLINRDGGTVNTISGEFKNNSAGDGGAIANSYNSSINSITGVFEENTAIEEGGAIANNSTIGTIFGTFTGNSVTQGFGGAIYNYGVINVIKGTFENNSAGMMGGAIANQGGFINRIEGTFTGNTSNMVGGAIMNMQGVVNISAIDNNTVFTGNKDVTGSNAITNAMGFVNLNAAEGKSIVINDAIGVSHQDIDNLITQVMPDASQDDINEAKAMFNAETAIININAKADDPNAKKFVRNYMLKMDGLTEEDYNNASAEEKAEADAMVDEVILQVNLPNATKGTIEINNKVKNQTVNMFDGTLKLGTNVQDGVEYSGTFDKDVNFNYYGGNVTLQNGGVNHANFGNMTLNNKMDLSLDADLANETMDTISANSFTSNGNQIDIKNINLLSASDKKSISLSPLATDMDATTRQNMAESIIYSGGDVAYGDIYKYAVEYDKSNAMLNFGLQGGKKNPTNLNDFAPSVATKPIAQSGAQNVQMDSYTEAFRNMDMFMLMPENERLAYKYRNKYASLDSDLVYDPTMSTYQNNTAWFRPYTTFENVPLKNGPKVSNVSYGTYFGYDSSLHELGKGWDGTLGVYAGYNGSHQTFQGNSIYQNGGTLGVIGVAYKGNFFTGWTLNMGASSGSTTTIQGSDNFNSLMGGISTKNGYNFEFADGKVIVQPSLLLSYSLVNTFDYTSASGARMKSDPLHTLQLEPSIKVIGNLGSWQPYANVAMVWNILNETNVKADNVQLPEVSVKPYVKYGVGLQKKWADKFTAFGQAYVTNGGRNGVGLQAGLRIALGDETEKQRAAWLDIRKKDTTIVLDGKVK